MCQQGNYPRGWVRESHVLDFRRDLTMPSFISLVWSGQKRRDKNIDFSKFLLLLEYSGTWRSVIEGVNEARRP